MRGILCGLALLGGITGSARLEAASPSESRNAPVPLDSSRVRSARAVTSSRPPLPMLRNLPAPGGGIFVPPELITLALEEREEERDEERGQGRAFEPRRLAPPEALPIGTNVRVNDTTHDPPRTCNAETSIAAWGRFMVAGWNDGEIYPDPPGASGYAYSTDWGRTWKDGGILPAVPPAIYRGDPVITVDGQGNFYYASLYSPDDIANNLSVNRGHFEGDSLVWDPPVMPVLSTPADFLDKEWLTCDPANGYLYLTWTRLNVLGGSIIEFSRSLDGGRTWSPRLALTSSISAGVQGSRVVVGPDHEIMVMWFAYDYVSRLTTMRCRRSYDFGETWDGARHLLTGRYGVINPFGSGPPGFNRGRGIGLPSLAVDRSSGPHRGRWYAVWEEAVDHQRDVLGAAGDAFETEPNGSPESATPFTIGRMVRATLDTLQDVDWYRFEGEAGQTVVLYLRPGAIPAGGGDLRLFCEGALPQNRVMYSDLGGGYSLIVYTLPRTGTYYLAVRVAVYFGNYDLATGWHTPTATELARDTRDIVFQRSANGLDWDPPRRISVERPYSDDSFPEVAVDGSGRVWVTWYGHGVDECAVLTDVYATWSDDGGQAFAPNTKVNDGPPVNWNTVATNLAPNMGDYIALIADDCRVYANFTDGREGTPDSWLALLRECATPITYAWRGFERATRGVRLLWQVSEDDAREVVLERRREPSDWERVAAGRSDARGELAFVDLEAEPGERYAYRLRSADASGEILSGPVWVDVPRAAGLFLQVAGSIPGGIPLTFALDGRGPARLDLFDVGGRRVRSVAVSREGDVPQRHVVGDLLPGLYWVRLSQGGLELSARAVVLR